MKLRDKQTLMPEGEEEAEHRLFVAIAAIKTAEEACDFFLDLCTPAELQAMADRWQVVQPVKHGIPYRKIYQDTGVSVTTIGRVARSITHGNNGYNVIYDRLEKKSNVANRTIKDRYSKKRQTT